MPYSDPAKNSAASNAWNKRNRERTRAASARWRAKRRRLRAMARVVRLLTPEPVRWKDASDEQRALLYKLRRCGVPRREARRVAYGGA